MFRALSKRLLTAMKPLAVIIKGNPKYIDDPKNKPLATEFYNEIKQLLVARGFRVTFSSGAAYSTPNLTAKAWIAHSRGIDRLQYTPKTVQTIALQTMDHLKPYKNGDDPLHYQLSEADRVAIAALHL
jgi:hypothetical protein